MLQPPLIQYARSARSIALLTCAALCTATLPAQTGVGLLAAGEFASRTVGSALDGTNATIEELRERTDFVFRPGVGIVAERQFSRLFAGSAQLSYRTAGYSYDFGGVGTVPNPFTGDPDGQGGSGTVRFRYEFISLALGASETWGTGTWRFYAEEYLVPMAYLRTANSAGGRSLRLDDANDFHLAVRGGAGAQTDIAADMRLRLGVTANYHFTQTFDDAGLREHLFGFGPQVSVMRVFGAEGTPEGPADEIYY